jgi:hypothetical protein
MTAAIQRLAMTFPEAPVVAPYNRCQRHLLTAWLDPVTQSKKKEKKMEINRSARREDAS